MSVIGDSFDERLRRVERKVFPPDCPTRWLKWFEHFCSLMPLNGRYETPGFLPGEDMYRGNSVPYFDGVPFKVCPFCGETLPHKDSV